MAFDFPASPTNGQQFTPAGGPTYAWNSTTGAWALASTISIADAPNDANAYVRSALAWVVGYTKAAIDTLLAAKAALASPTFTGNPLAPTPAAGDNDTSIATTAFVQTEFGTRVVTRSVMTSASGTWNRPTGCRFVDVEIWGGGGGGGGVAATGATQGAAGGGGGAGGYAHKLYDVRASPSFAWTVGGAGSGGSAAATGGAGGQTNFGPSLVASGGSGGNGSAASGSNFVNTYGGAGGAGSNGDVNVSAAYGGNGTGSPQNFTASLGGAGANSTVGGGALPLYGSSAGGVGVGFASGGGGGCNGQSQGAAKAGGAGTGGLIIVTEYY